MPCLSPCGLQDSNINLWWTDNGVRAGSFDGHNGVVWTVDMTCERCSAGLQSSLGCASCHLVTPVCAHAAHADLANFLPGSLPQCLSAP